MAYTTTSVAVHGSSILTKVDIRSGQNVPNNYAMKLAHEQQVWWPQQKMQQVDDSYFGFGKDAVVVFEFTNPTSGGEKAHNYTAYPEELGANSTLAKITVYANADQYRAGTAAYQILPQNGINSSGGGGGNLSNSEQGAGDLYLAFQTNVMTKVERLNGYTGPIAQMGNEMMIVPTVNLYQTLVVDKQDVILNRVSDLNADGSVVSRGNGFFTAGDINDYVEDQLRPPICFVKGTMIATRRGPIAVEDLKVGDEVLTADHDYQLLRWIGKRLLDRYDLARAPKLRPICIAANALAPNVPQVPLHLSPQHRVLLRSKVAERMFGTNEVLAPVKHLVAEGAIAICETCESVEYFHLLFDAHEVVFANGAAVESLYTGSQALKSLSGAARRQVFEIFPELCGQEHLTPPARLFVQGKALRQMLKRHAANQKPLLAS